jgi:hypothetical protein
MKNLSTYKDINSSECFIESDNITIIDDKEAERLFEESLKEWNYIYEQLKDM